MFLALFQIAFRLGVLGNFLLQVLIGLGQFDRALLHALFQLIVGFLQRQFQLFLFGDIRDHAQEMDDEVCAAHIGLYVNAFSLDLAEEGRTAVTTLLRLAEERGVMPRFEGNMFEP